MSWANVLTFGRIALTPLFVYLMYAGEARPSSAAVPVLAIAVFAAAALSDSLDGYLARRQGRISALGQFLDPLADKLLVGAALVTLVALREFPVWAAAVIFAREIVVSVLRSAALRRGRSMPASLSGKIKTAMQIPMVMLWLLPRAGAVRAAQDAAVYLAVGLTLLSGARYLARARALLRREDAPTG